MPTAPNPSNSPKRIASVYRRIAELRWPIVIIVVGVAAVHQAILFGLLRFFPARQQTLIQLAVYSLTGVIVVLVGLHLLLRTTTRQEQAERDLVDAYAELELTHRQLQTIHEVGRRVTNSSDVPELMAIAARIPVDIMGAVFFTLNVNAQSFKLKDHKTSLLFTFANGLADGTRDAAMFHMNDASSRWWNSDESWENKYKDYPNDMSPAFWGSTNVLVWTTDAPHFFNMLSNQAMSFAIVTYPGNSGKLKHIVRDAIIYNVTRQMGHSLMYKVILK